MPLNWPRLSFFSSTLHSFGFNYQWFYSVTCLVMNEIELWDCFMAINWSVGILCWDYFPLVSFSTVDLQWMAFKLWEFRDGYVAIILKKLRMRILWPVNWFACSCLLSLCKVKDGAIYMLAITKDKSCRSKNNKG